MQNLESRLPQAVLDEAGAYADVLYPEQVHLSIGARIANLTNAGEVGLALSVAESVIEHGKREGLVMTADRNERGHLIAVRTNTLLLESIKQLAAVKRILEKAEELIASDQFDLDYDLISQLHTALD